MSPTEPQQWQRLAPLALVFLVIDGLQKFIRENLFWFLGAGAGFAFLDWLGPRELLLVVIAILLSFLAWAIIFHRRFRFRLDDDAIRVRRGLFQKRELKVRFARVQNIQLGRPFYFRPFGLVRFSLETPGAAEKEVELPGIPAELAEIMRDRVTGWQAGEPVEDQSTEEAVDSGGIELYHAGTGRLFLHGLSSNQIWVLAGLVGWMIGNFYDRLENYYRDFAIMQWLSDVGGPAWMVIAAMIMAGLIILMILSGLFSIVRFHDYRMFDRGDRLVGIGGLLDQREQTVKRDKVTGLTLQQSALGRLLGCWYLIVRQTQSGDQELSNSQTRFLAPGLRRSDHALTARITPEWIAPGLLKPISLHFRRVFWLRWLVFFVLVLVVLAILFDREHWSLQTTAAAMVLWMIGIQLRWRHWGWQADGDRIWVRQGMLGQQFDVFDLTLVQQVRITQSPYQRRHALATLQLTLPQGAVTIPFMPLDDAAELANRALFAAETAVTHRV
jgi:putative membrane protein